MYFNSIFCGLISGLLFISSAVAQSVEEFSELPTIDMPSISPDGQKIAYVRNQDEFLMLVVLDLETGENTATDISHMRPHGVRWASNSIVLLSASEVQQFYFQQADVSATFSINLDEGMRARQLMRSSLRLGLNISMSRIVGRDPETGNLFMPAYDEEYNYSLYLVDPETYRFRLIETGNDNTRDWVVDENGNILARMDLSRDANFLRVYVYEDGEPEIAFERSDLGAIPISLWGQDPNGNLVISMTKYNPDNQRSTRGLYELSASEGIDNELFRDDYHDLDHTVFDPYTNRVIGAAYYDANSLNRIWFDEDLKSINNEIDLIFEGYDEFAEILNWSEDRRRILLHVEGPSSPPGYFLYETDTQSISNIGSAYPSIPFGSLPERVSIEYLATDGTMIPAYMTVPDGDGPFPTVMLPHGGPAARDYGGFDWFAHFLASRGYLVLQPNFRGSVGYGSEWKTAGYGEWGRGIMQSDLDDGLSALISEGLADPDKTCIVGGSYGGYAALAGAAFTPTLYNCAVAIAPVSDLQEMLNYVSRRAGNRHWAVQYWMRQFAGRSDEDFQDLIRHVSPASYAQDVQIPVLLIHGRDDTVVSIDQSRIMYRALQQNDKTVEFISVATGDHWLTSEEMRYEALSNLEDFLAEHLQ